MGRSITPLSHDDIGLDELRGWVSRLNSLLTICLETHVALEDCSVRKHLALQDERPVLVTKWETERKKHQHALATAEAQLWAWTGQRTIEDANALVIDVRVRVQQAWELYEMWRKAVSLAELMETLTHVDPEMYPVEDLTKATHAAQQLQREFTLQLELAIHCLPTNAREVLTCN
jgi:hypothetical protein